ncbi:hypothetical protein SAMN05444161_8343 [Rhizobiales bacterium GAS191]|nr:hypothetical protein SAMN05444161_8343 [Rhizobiales bacterium GAS191]
MTESNTPPRRPSKSSKPVEALPHRMKPKQPWTTKLKAPFYYAESFSSYAEMAQAIILTAEVPFLMKTTGKVVPLSVGEARVTMRMSPHTARGLLRWLKLAIGQLEEQEKAQARHEKGDKENARRFWNRVVAPQLARSENNDD